MLLQQYYSQYREHFQIKRLNENPSYFGDVFAGSVLIFLFLLAKDPMLFALFLAAHFIVLSASTPTWNALLGKIIPEKVRGKVLGKVNAIAFAGRFLQQL